MLRQVSGLGGGGAPSGGRSFTRLVAAGLGWSMGATLLSRLWVFGLGVLLARLLQPRDYGIYTIGLAALAILQSMNDAGVSLAIVRWEGDPLRAAQTATTIAVLSSVALYGVAFLLAPAVAGVVRAPQATGVLRLVTFGVVLDGISSVPNALLNRAIRQARRAVADIASLAVLTVVTVLLARRGFGAWSLAWGSVAGNTVATLLICLLAPSFPRPGFRRTDAHRLLRFGLPLAGSSLLVFAVLNVDYLVVSRLLGPDSLGLYLLAFNLSSWPSNVLSHPIRQVSVAAFSRIDERERVALFLRSMGVLASVVFLVAALLSSLAFPAVRLVYGLRWEAAAGALRYLALLGALRVAIDFCYDFFVAQGRPRTTLLLQTFWLALLVPSLVLGASAGGIEGVGLAHAAVALLAVGPAFLFALRRSGVRARTVARGFLRPAIAGTIAFLLVTGVAGSIQNDSARLGAGALAGTAAYLLSMPRSLARGIADQLRGRLLRNR